MNRPEDDIIEAHTAPLSHLSDGKRNLPSRSLDWRSLAVGAAILIAALIAWLWEPAATPTTPSPTTAAAASTASPAASRSVPMLQGHFHISFANLF